jgi:hypothetical protein
MEDKNLEDIRHYKGTWKKFADFFKSKGVSLDPYEGTILKYPEVKKSPKNLPYQDFGTFTKSDKNEEI